MCCFFFSLSLLVVRALSFVTSRRGKFKRPYGSVMCQQQTNRKSPTNRLQTVGNVCRMCVLCLFFCYFFSCVATQNHSKEAKPTSRAISNFPDRCGLFRRSGEPINCIVASSVRLSLRLILSGSAQRRPPARFHRTGNRGRCFHPVEPQNGALHCD